MTRPKKPPETPAAFEPARPRSAIARDTDVAADVPMEPLVASESAGIFTPASLQRAVSQKSAIVPLGPSDSGELVVALQRELRELGLLPQGALSDGEGQYGTQTAAAVRRFQREHGLAETGAADGRSRLLIRAGLRNR